MSRRGGKVLLALLVLSVTTIVTGSSEPVSAAVVQPFAVQYTTNTTGAIVMTGNTLLTCPGTAANCLAARSATAPTNGANNNNNYAMRFVDVDTDPTTFNSSRNTLNLPPDSTVLFAGLYWGADTTGNGTGGSPAPDASIRDRVLLRTPGSTTSRQVIAIRDERRLPPPGPGYQEFADVTSLVAEGRSGEYTLANVQAGTGNDRYAGWALVVAYQDRNEPLRNLTVFDGYAVVRDTPTDSNVSIPVSGFLTPPTGPVRSRVGVVAYEGDFGITGDSLRVGNTQLTNSLNPATNFFNSSLTGLNSTNTTGDPFQKNMMGVDIDTIRADGVIPNGATGTTINLNTSGDTYFPGVITFSTELFSPEVALEKSAVDVNGGTLDVGDEVLYSLRATNVGDNAADAVVVEDPIPAGADFVAGSLTIDGNPMTDAAGDDRGEALTSPERVVARIGTGATSSTGGSLAIGASATVSFRVVITDAVGNGSVSNRATVAYRDNTSGIVSSGASNLSVLSPRPRSDLRVEKFGSSDPVTVPGNVDYRLIVTNRAYGTDPAVVVVDTPPAGFTPISASASTGSCEVGADIRCALGSLAVGESVQIDVVMASGGSGQATNTATVSGANVDPLPNSNAASSVTVLNRAPTATNKTVNVAGNTSETIDVLVDADDLDGDIVTTFGTTDRATDGPANGSVVVNVDGTVTYTPNAGFRGNDTFDFVVTDGRGGFGTATVEITVTNIAPVAVSDERATLRNQFVDIDVVENDSDANGDTLTVTSVTTPSSGTVDIIGPRTVRFTPAADFTGEATFTYVIDDGSGSANSTATTTVTVKTPNTGPVAVADFAETATNTAVPIAVVANDLDDDLERLTVAAFAQPADQAVSGTVTQTDDQTLTFTPVAGYKGTTTFTYEVTDGTSSTDTATVTVTVRNAPPESSAIVTTTASNTPVSVDLVGASSDLNTADVLTVVGTTTPGNGSVSVDAAGVATYTPTLGFKGVDSFEYTVSDGEATSTSQVSVDVANAAPSGAVDRRETPSGTAVTIPVLANDFDPNGDELTVESATAPANGTVSINADGTVTYTPNAGFKGVDTFVYTLSDGEATSTALVTVVVLDAEPVAVADSATTSTGTPVTVSVLANDADPNDDLLTVVSTTTPPNGSVVVNADGTITYTPDPGFEGDDVFTYTITDGTTTATTTVTITVSATPPTTTTTTTTTVPGDPTTTTTAVPGEPTSTTVPGDPTATTVPGDPSTPTTVASVTTRPQPVGVLPRTGSESWNLLRWAMVLLLGGVVTWAAVRRRPRPA